MTLSEKSLDRIKQNKVFERQIKIKVLNNSCKEAKQLKYVGKIMKAIKQVSRLRRKRKELI